MSRVASLLLLGALLPTVAHASPWTRQFGKHYVKLGVDGYVPFRYLDPTGRGQGATYHGEQIGFYGEVGLTPKWPLQLSIQAPLTFGTLVYPPDGRSAWGAVRATTIRMGDLRFGLQTQIWEKKVPVAFQTIVKVPGYRIDDIGADSGIWQELYPRPGDGQIDVDLWLKVGGALNNVPMWLEGGIGWRFRTEAFVGWDTDFTFEDSLIYRATVGGVVDPAMIMLQIDGNVSPRFDDVSREALQLGPAVLVDVWKQLAVEARVAIEPWTRNVSQGVGFGLGISWRADNE